MRRPRTAVAIAAIASLGLAACGNDDDASTDTAASTVSADSTGSTAPGGATTAKPSVVDPNAGKSVQLNLVGFAVPQAANNAIQKKFAETPQGKGTSWKESYGASGDQSRAVVSGLKADYVHFSIPPDVTRLEKEGLVADTWDNGPTKGIVSDSVVVLAVRPGNPKNIRTWDDIVKPGIGIVTPNPASSGAARWNILAAYQQVIANGGTSDAAKAYLTKFFNNAVALPGSGREATSAFLAGTGDVLIAYENETILARQSGQKIDYVVPDTTLLIENPGAVTKSAPPRAQLWLDFVLSAEGQTEFAKKGFRPVIDGIKVDVEGANDPKNPFPAPKTLLTVDKDLGGWTKATADFFAEGTGISSVIQAAAGKT